MRVSEQKITLLPEIKGQVRSIKQLLLQDLEADGIVKRNIPFSTSRRKASVQVESKLGLQPSFATQG